jgi:hypothetical protein
LTAKVRFAEEFMPEPSKAQLVFPPEKVVFVFRGKNNQCAATGYPLTLPGAFRVLQKQLRQRVARLHGSLRMGQVPSHEDI